MARCNPGRWSVAQVRWGVSDGGWVGCCGGIALTFIVPALRCLGPAGLRDMGPANRYAELEPCKNATGATTTLQDTVFSTVPGAPVFVGPGGDQRLKPVYPRPERVSLECRPTPVHYGTAADHR